MTTTDTAAIPNGATLTTYDQLFQLADAAGWSLPVVLDCYGVPWILYCNEDGDDFAATVPCPDLGIPDQIPLCRLADHGPLIVVFNGDRDDLDSHTQGS
jgi:hypothetical protein